MRAQKDWRSRKPSMQATRAPRGRRGAQLGRGDACELAGETRARQARPLSTSFWSIPCGENLWYRRVTKFSPYGSVCCTCAQRPGLPRACHSGKLACLALQAVLSAHVAFAPRARLRQFFSRMLGVIKIHNIFSMGPKRRYPMELSVPLTELKCSITVVCHPGRGQMRLCFAVTVQLFYRC
jgi:hypothetical protein